MSTSEMFLSKLLKWHQSIDRKLPWKSTKDPYIIWVSEVILQQTRVEQGLPYYHQFIESFPSIEKLAAAEEDEVLKVWQGLGYYSRARNMHYSAKEVVKKYGGRFPESYADILSLKGVGPYTAAAIASFAFDQPYAVVDGNVQRVISRYYGIGKDLKLRSGKKEIEEIVDGLIITSDPATFNQAIMDFGAMQCVPRNPDCTNCPLVRSCYSYKNDKVSQLPYLNSKIRIRKRYLHYIIIESGSKIHIEKRGNKGIWAGLYQFKLVEMLSSKALDLDRISNLVGFLPSAVDISKRYRHKLSHQDLFIVFYRIETDDNSENLSSFNLVDKGNLRNFAFPKIIDRYLEDKSIYL